MRTICLSFSILLMATAMTVAQRDLDTSDFDRSVRAQDDLFRFVNGSWLENTEIPSDKSNYGSFIELDDMSRERIRDLIQALAENDAEAGSDEQKIGDFYKSYMDTQEIEAAGITPLKANSRNSTSSNQSNKSSHILDTCKQSV